MREGERECVFARAICASAWVLMTLHTCLRFVLDGSLPAPLSVGTLAGIGSADSRLTCPAWSVMVHLCGEARLGGHRAVLTLSQLACLLGPWTMSPTDAFFAPATRQSVATFEKSGV